MENLIDVLQSLNKGELALLQENLEANPNLKRSKLLSRLLANPNFSKGSDSEVLSGPAKYQLVYSTKEWLLGFILQQNDNSKFSSHRGKKKYQAYKFLLYSHVCTSRGLVKESYEYLSKAQKIAKKHDFLELEMEVIEQTLMKELLGNSTSKLSALKSRQKELVFLLECRNEFNWIKQRLSQNRENATNLHKTHIELFESSLERIKELAEQSGLAQIQEEYLKTSFRFYSRKNEFKTALNIAQAFLKLVEQRKLIAGNSKMAGGNMILATTYNRLGKFKKAYPYSVKAVELFGDNMKNVEIASHVQFTCLFHLRDFTAAKLLSEEIIANKWVKSQKMRIAKWRFFEVLMFFEKGQFDAAISALRNCRDLMKDRTGWHYGYRVMEILIQYENIGPDILDTYINNFRRFIRKHPPEKKTRIALILKVLTALEKSRFNFKRVGKSHAKMLKTLALAEGVYFYEPAGFEMIRFDKWFRKHLKKQK